MDKLLHKIAHAYGKKLTEKSGNLGHIKVGHDSRLEINEKTMKCKFVQEFRPHSMLAISDILQVSIGQEYDGEIVFAIDAKRIKPNQVHDPDRISDCATGWMPREVAEEDETFQHLIPYIAICDNKGRVLVYERNGGEERLHGYLSIGWGGHIDRSLDMKLEDGKMSVPGTIFNCLYREVDEEIGVDMTDTAVIQPVYFARYDKTPVDRVHACLAFVGVLTEQNDIHRAANYGEWVDLNPLKFAKYLKDRKGAGRPHELETWSADLYDKLTNMRDLPLNPGGRV